MCECVCVCRTTAAQYRGVIFTLFDYQAYPLVSLTTLSISSHFFGNMRILRRPER